MDYETYKIIRDQAKRRESVERNLLGMIRKLEHRLETYQTKTDQQLYKLERKTEHMLQSQGQTKRKKIRQHSKKTPRRLLREFATSTWCYGLPALVRSRTRCFRFMWIIAILLSTSACAFMIWQTMSEYLAYTVVTEIESKERRSLIFPQITICGFWLTQPPKMEEIYQIDVCRANLKDDCRQDFEYIEVYDYSLGIKCLRINSGKNATGHWQGLRQQTRQKHTENGYNFVISTVAKYKPLTNNVYIHDYPYQPIYSSPHFALNDGTSLAVRLHKSVDMKLPYAFNDCIGQAEIQERAKSNDLILRTFKYNGIYSKDHCDFVCFFKHMSQLYNCSFPGVYDTDNLYKCNYENWTNLHNDFDYDTNCFEHCPRECDSIKYEYEPQDLGGVAAVGDHVIPLSNSSFSICIYFQDLKYTEISQKPKTTWSDLISKIGGTLGLFIGVRLLSLMEIFQFVIEIGKMFAKTYVRN